MHISLGGIEIDNRNSVITSVKGKQVFIAQLHIGGYKAAICFKSMKEIMEFSDSIDELIGRVHLEMDEVHKEALLDDADEQRIREGSL